MAETPHLHQSETGFLNTVSVYLEKRLIIIFLMGFASGLPLLAVNHLEGHVYSNWLRTDGNGLPPGDNFPLLVLIVSGGHTELVLMRDEVASLLQGNPLPLVGYVSQLGEGHDDDTQVVEGADPGDQDWESRPRVFIENELNPLQEFDLPIFDHGLPTPVSGELR